MTLIFTAVHFVRTIFIQVFFVSIFAVSCKHDMADETSQDKATKTEKCTCNCEHAAGYPDFGMGAMPVLCVKPVQAECSQFVSVLEPRSGQSCQSSWTGKPCDGYVGQRKMQGRLSCKQL